MDVWMGLAWLVAGMIAGVVLGLALGSRRTEPQEGHSPFNRQQMDLQREALERMRESNLALAARLQELTSQYERQMETLRKTHAMERISAEEDLRVTREQLRRIISSVEDGSSISAQAFAPTQFDEPDAKRS
ncbi:hypothetical protein [Ideonella livida]|uniref:DUF1043 family protein n=1 Tax=Ideonella livida TaxID=2707176 RepID=A0A7C9TKW9_9BURK|nr:hypothetical protein [Ideonella livida]NDY93001.1 hypothetical protein [Ideonella livida]